MSKDRQELEPWESHPWELRDPPAPWDARLRGFNWPECGDTETTTEELYQAFKARLMAEIIAEGPHIYDNALGATRSQRYPLVEKPND